MTAGDLGRLVVTVLGMVADMEPRFIRDRRRASGARGPDPKINGTQKRGQHHLFQAEGLFLRAHAVIRTTGDPGQPPDILQRRAGRRSRRSARFLALKRKRKHTMSERERPAAHRLTRGRHSATMR